MSRTTIGEVQSVLAASRSGAEQLLEQAGEQVAQIDAEAGTDALPFAAQRLHALNGLQEAIRGESERLEIATAALIESLGAVSGAVVELARTESWAPPAWPRGLAGRIDEQLGSSR